MTHREEKRVLFYHCNHYLLQNNAEPL